MPSAKVTQKKLKGSRPLYPLVGLVLIALLMVLAGAGILGNRLALAAPVTVTVQVGQKPDGTAGNRYNPAVLNVNSGDTVSFIRFAGTHDVQSAVVPAGGSPFTSPSPMVAGTPFNVAPAGTGTYTYYCTIHSDPTEATLANVDANIAAGFMVGKIVVAAAATPTPVPATPTPIPPTPTATTPPSGTPATTPSGTPTTPPATATPTTPPSATATPTTPSATATPSATSTPTPAPTPVTTAPGDIRIIDFGYDPVVVSVPTGTSVRWVNTGTKKHTVTANDSSFDSGLMVTGDAFSRTFNTDGSYQYYCDLHPDMVGTVNVGAGGSGASPTATATPAPLPPAAPGSVQIIDYDYLPKDLSVAVGASVRFVNVGAKKHTVTATDGSFDSGLMAPGDAFSRTFNSAGVFQYYCDLHPAMTGSVTVSDGTGGGNAWPLPPGIPANLLYNEIWNRNTGKYTTGAVSSVAEITSGNSAFWGLILQGVRSGTITAADLPPNIVSFVNSQYSRLGGPPASFNANKPAATPVPPTAATPSPAGAPRGTAGASEVEIVDFSYNPRVITVQPGASLRFVNAGIAKHTVTALDGSFDSGFMAKGDAFSRAFTEPGAYDYFCVIHPDMVGTVQVAASAGSVPPAAAAPTSPALAAPPAAAPGDVRIVDFDYSPRTLTVNAGASVRFVNAGIAPHTVTALDGSFDSGLMSKSDAYTRRFAAPGAFDYYCIIHPNMTGSVRVLDATGSAPPPIAAMVAPPTAAGAAAASESAASSVAMIDLAFDPKTVTVRRGTEVIWRNTGIAPHTVTARDNTFDSGLVQRGGQFTRRFESAGTFAYYCTLHPNMEGAVLVSDTAPAPGAAALAATPGKEAGASNNLTSAAGRPDHTMRNAWMVIWGVAALVAVVMLPMAVYGLRSPANRRQQ